MAWGTTMPFFIGTRRPAATQPTRPSPASNADEWRAYHLTPRFVDVELLPATFATYEAAVAAARERWPDGSGGVVLAADITEAEKGLAGLPYRLAPRPRFPRLNLLFNLLLLLVALLWWTGFLRRDVGVGSLQLAGGLLLIALVPVAWVVKLIGVVLLLLVWLWFLYLPAVDRYRIRRSVRGAVSPGASRDEVDTVLRRHGWGRIGSRQYEKPGDRLTASARGLLGRYGQHYRLTFTFDAADHLSGVTVTLMNTAL